jgi:hypothetical protein
MYLCAKYSLVPARVAAWPDVAGRDPDKEDKEPRSTKDGT